MLMRDSSSDSIGSTRSSSGGATSRFSSGPLAGPLLSRTPVRVLQGHTRDVLSLSWGK